MQVINRFANADEIQARAWRQLVETQLTRLEMLNKRVIDLECELKNIQESRDKLYEENNKLRDRVRELEREVRSALTDTDTRRAELAAQTTTLAAEEEALLAYRDQFAVGRSSINDLLDAQRDLFQAAVELVNRRVRWEQASFQQLAVTGELLDALEIHIERR